MDCAECVWNLALRLVRNHPQQLDLIDALVRAQKGINRYFDGCGGSPTPCNQHDNQGDCIACGCTWRFIICYGTPIACTFAAQSDCERCGCTWTPPVSVLLLRMRVGVGL